MQRLYGPRAGDDRRGFANSFRPRWFPAEKQLSLRVNRIEGAVVLTAAIVMTGLLILVSWGRMAWWSLRIASWYPLAPVPDDVAARNWPRAAVLLPLRGSDPLLIDCLRGLCRQDYPDFEVVIVVDHPNDDAWEPVRQAIAEFPQVRIRTMLLTERLETCSLKSSALIQAVRSLGTDVEFAAVVDADVVAQPWWLRELVRPMLDDSSVGAVGGLRWYIPERTNCGSVIRRIWNAAASAQMYALGIPWGGSLAYRAELLRDPRLLQRWAETFVEDVSVADLFHASGRRLLLVPRLSMVNTETISLASCFRFMRRQIFSVRMYNPAWNQVVFTCLGLVASCVLTAIVNPIVARSGITWVPALLASLLAAMILVTTIPLLYVEYCLHRSEPKERNVRGLTILQLPLIPVTIVVYGLAVFSACRMREIDWRGIRYSVGAGGRILRLNDVPFGGAASSKSESLV
jgi:cellulose synthase/poly-beta-1,6-N-acetylglucosamine synthase-like glycosyltransferase